MPPVNGGIPSSGSVCSRRRVSDRTVSGSPPVGRPTGTSPSQWATPSRSVSADGADTPTNDHRDHDRPFSADSSRNVPGRSPASDAYSATGVSVSASSLRVTGMTLRSLANSRNSSRVGWISPRALELPRGVATVGTDMAVIVPSTAEPRSVRDLGHHSRNSPGSSGRAHRGRRTLRLDERESRAPGGGQDRCCSSRSTPGFWRLILCGIIFGATLLGLWIGRGLRERGDTLREPLGVLQGSILGVVGLVLAFGLALAVGRYEARRAVVVDDANAIGTAYLRAQTLPEPIRSSSLQLLTSYTDAEIALSDHLPGSDDSVTAVAVGADLQPQLWTLGGRALQADPNGNASRLYVESLNEVINLQTLHVAALSNRVPGTVLLLEVLGAAAALGLLAVYLAVLGRGVLPVLLGAALVAMVLFVTFDLDRPTRGLIQVEPTALIAQRASMDLPPAAPGPG